MAKITDFIAFNAAIELLKDSRQTSIINDVYKKCKAQENAPKEEVINHVKEIYAPFTDQQIAHKVSQLVTSGKLSASRSRLPSIADLHEPIPDIPEIGIFTGDYPNPCGNKVVISPSSII
jgi:amidophosphoribosyltransferase